MTVKERILLVFFSLVALSSFGQTVVIPDVWINEIHYNNTGNDTLTGFEIAGPAGTNLACYEVVWYNGGNGQAYLVDTLSGTLSNQQANFGTAWFGVPAASIQNINNGGLALVYAPQATGCGANNVDTVLQFLAYGGAFTALNGRAQWLTSTNLPVAESSSTAVGSSLQLTGTGNKYLDFFWQAPSANTYGQPNTTQTFVVPGPVIQFDTSNVRIGERFGVYNLGITISNYNANPDTVYLITLAGATAIVNNNYSYASNFVVFPGNSSSTQFFPITIIDDSFATVDLSVDFKLINPGNQASLGADSVFQLVIYNEDILKISLPTPTLTVKKDTGLITFPVHITFGCWKPTQVDVKVYAPGTTAVKGIDYQFKDTTITWPIGVRGDIQVPVTILNDALNEPDRVIQFELTNPNNGAILLDTAFVLTILEVDTGPKAVMYFNIISDTVEMPQTDSFYNSLIVTTQNPRADTVFAVVVANPAMSTAVEGNSAPADFHFSAQGIKHGGPGTFYDTIGLNSSYGPFQLFPDPAIIPMKTIGMHFIEVTGELLIGSDSLFTLYIKSHNKLVVSFLGAGLSYPKDTPLVKIPVVISTFPSEAVSVNVTNAPGNALPGLDYVFNDTTVIFPAFSTDTQGVWVHLLNNSIYQSNKQVNFNLSSPTNGAVLGINGYTLTIINNDSLAGIISDSQMGKAIDIFPNPAIDFLNIKNPFATGSLTITDVLGNVLSNHVKITNELTNVDVSNFPSGVYIVTIKIGNKILSRRFIK